MTIRLSPKGNRPRLTQGRISKRLLHMRPYRWQYARTATLAAPTIVGHTAIRAPQQCLRLLKRGMLGRMRARMAHKTFPDCQLPHPCHQVHSHLTQHLCAHVLIGLGVFSYRTGVTPKLTTVSMPPYLSQRAADFAGLSKASRIICSWLPIKHITRSACFLQLYQES